MTHYTVLGTKGFIGSHMLAYLQARNISYVAPERGDESIFSKDLGHVIYCIGLTADYRERPYDTVEAHVSLLSRILQKANFKRLVYLSSTRLYDGQKIDICHEDSDLTFNPANPRHLYDLSKSMGENLCLTASDGRASVARLSGVYDKSAQATGFLSVLLQRLPYEKEFTLNSATGISRDYIHVDDVLDALIKIVDADASRIINVASGENISNQDIMDVVNSYGYNISCQRQSEREKRPACDISRLRDLGIHPTSVTTYLHNMMKTE